MARIRFQISPKGDVQIVTEGYAGTSCKDASAPFERALGKTVSDSDTPEMYAQEAERAEVAQ